MKLIKIGVERAIITPSEAVEALQRLHDMTHADATALVNSLVL